MVFVNATKFACANCINGHRSSSCSHTERPLYEIKKKGRPVSQCMRCRDLRKTRRIHVKCICEDRPPQEPPIPWPATRKTAPRRIPSMPTLPNGLKDLDHALPMLDMRGPMSSHHFLLNPSSPTSTDSSPSQSPVLGRFSLTGPNVPLPPPPSPPQFTSFAIQASNVSMFSRTQNPYTSGSFVRSAPSVSLPGVKELVSSNDACRCGSGCMCSGCPTHRGAAAFGRSCRDGCGTCVDNESPETTSLLFQSIGTKRISPTQALIEKSAAMIPPPPRPSSQYSSPMIGVRSGHPSSAATRLLPLSCCRGRCGCAPGECSCGEDCHGCGSMDTRFSNGAYQQETCCR